MKRKVSLQLDGTQQTVTVTRVGNGYTVEVGDRVYAVTDVRAQDGTLAFFAGNRSVFARVSNAKDAVFLSVRGRTFRMPREVSDADRAPGAAAHGGSGVVDSPMPGNIVAVRVKPGDAVQAGDPVVVLESMKMQNEITAPVAGTVQSVACEEGQQVGFGDVLLTIEPAAEGAQDDTAATDAGTERT